jgi:hypothetical protein
VRFGEFDFVPPLVSYAEFAISPRFLHDSLRETSAALHNFLVQLFKFVRKDVDADGRMALPIVLK